MDLILMTAAMQPTAEVLPALGLLQHSVTVLPLDAAALVDHSTGDLLVVDARRDLAGARSFTRVLAAVGMPVPVVDCVRLWHLRRKAWDAIDLASTTVFTALILAIAVVLHTYDSPAAFAGGGAAAAVSYWALRRMLRLSAVRGD